MLLQFCAAAVTVPVCLTRDCSVTVTETEYAAAR
jgi:hypothetical protein